MSVIPPIPTEDAYMPVETPIVVSLLLFESRDSGIGKLNDVSM